MSALLIPVLYVALAYVAVFVTASTVRHMRFGNQFHPHPFPFRYALACALAQTLLTPPLANHRARVKAMRTAEVRRQRALALSMSRHPAGSALAHPAFGATTTEVDFATRARTTHVSDQVAASIASAKAMHPATRAKAIAAS